MTYDLSGVGNSTSIAGLLGTANTLTNNLFGVCVLTILALFLMFGFMTRNTIKTSIAASLFITSIASVLFTYLGLVDGYIAGSFIILLVGSVAFLVGTGA